MAHNGDDPPWLRPSPVLALPAKPDTRSSSGSSSTSFPPTETTSFTLLPPPHISTPARPAGDGEEQYVGWKPQQITAQQVAHSPPLSPLDLAMYPGAPVASDPRRAVAGLKPLRILSSRRPGGPASAGPSRPPSVEATRPGSGFMGLFAAAKRASVTALAGPSTSSPRASGQSTPASHAPIPVSPLPPPRTPPLVPQLALPPQFVGQVEPALKEYLEALAVQAAANPPSSSSSRRPSESAPRPTTSIPVNPLQDEEMVLEIRDLNTGEIIKIRDLDAVNRKSQSTSQRPPSISELLVVRNLDAQPRTPPPPPPLRPQRQRNRAPQRRPLTPPRSLSPIKLHSPLLPIPNSHRSPTTPLSEAVYVNRNLELSLSNLENALSIARNLSSHARTNSAASRHIMQTPKTAHTSSSHMSSMFSSHMLGSPLTTPPASPPPLPRLKDVVALPCMVCTRPMQNMTSTRCGHVFCRGCVEGRIACPVCRVSVQDDDLRAIYLFV